ncbi:MAG: N-acetylmuramoyl-L-alanine amidase [Rhodobiaceae bacterium]|nr:N-acetylmuramoyl-L-alanine amidase [Rhodobiaceae bacterium]MCC0040847.1 N-acetylmuramoyl-L-alanine amidase [Rhodobiaceae bacterium]
MPRYRMTPSPNHGERREGPVDMLVLHYTGMERAQAAHDWLCDPKSEVSSHYFVYENGDICQLVAEDRRAWHAGAAAWGGVSDINSRSIGIEIANPGHAYGYPDFPAVQMEAVTALCADICARLAIAPRLVLAHSDVAPARKIDPGEKFDWALLARHGIGHWVVPAPARGGRFFQQGDSGQPVEALQAMLALYGYGVEVSGIYDTTTQQAVSAFQRHFRQEKVDGIADVSTIETLHRLLSALP